MLGWEHFAVPGFVEKVVLTARIRAYVIFTAASVVHTAAGPVLHGCWVGACVAGAEALKSGPVQVRTLKEHWLNDLGMRCPSQPQFLHL